MKKIIFTLIACWMTGAALADELNWLTSVGTAMDQAKRENKLVMVDFTGSDWCGWCKKLDAETFSQPEFADFAAKNLVMVQLDYPAHKVQSAELKEVNKEWKAKYEIRGFPTVMLMKPDGTVLWKQVGFLKGGPAAMIAKVNEAAPRSPGSPSTPAPVVNVPVQWPAPPARKPGDEPRLQGIFYSTSHASILLEGKNCEEGDMVEGMRVVKIARDKVTVEWKGKTEELTMK